MLEGGPIVLIICAIVGASACATRFYIRVVTTHRTDFLELGLIFATVMQLTQIGMQLRVFQLLPTTAENHAHFLEAQKLTFAGTFPYFASLWAVKISINILHIRLTRSFRRIQFLATCHLYFLIGTWPFLYITYILACWPVSRKWSTPPTRSCGPIRTAWDFWAHFAIHLATDFTLCVLPFPALLKVSERRLRIAICLVYSIAFVDIIVSVTRIVLLATDVQNSLKRIMALTSIETTVCLVVGILPGISSSFTKRYVQGGLHIKKPTHSGRLSGVIINDPAFSHLSSNDISAVESGNDVNTLESHELGHRAFSLAKPSASKNSFIESIE